MIYWFYLILGGLFEVFVTICLGKVKVATGLGCFGWGAALLCGMATSLYLVTKSMTGIPLGVAYAVWTGIGVAGAVVVGYLFFGEALSTTKILFIILLIIAIIGLEQS